MTTDNTVPLSDEEPKHERDSRPRYSQYDLDAATKPLHETIDHLTKQLAEAERALRSTMTRWRV